MREEHQTKIKMPKPLRETGHNIPLVNGPSLECINVNTLRARSNTLLPDHYHEINIGDNILHFYTQNSNIDPDIPCVFIIAGRKNEARFLPPNPSVRTILILSKSDYEEIKPLPAAVDYLVIDTLQSSTHGKFEDAYLGLIIPRRLCALLFAHYYNIKHCMMSDDNIEKFTLANNTIEVSDFYRSLFSQVQDNVCVSVQTMRMVASARNTQENRLGSKVFVFNMPVLKKLFEKPEALFYLFPPSKCVDWWGEDYFMQCMLINTAEYYRLSGKGMQVLDLQEFGGFDRIRSHKNVGKKALETAEDFVEKENVFIESIQFESMNKDFSKLIVKSYNSVKDIVQDRVKIAKKQNKKMMELDIQKAHADANHIAYNSHTTPIRSIPFTEVWTQAKEDLEKLEAILYPHQMQSLQQLFNENKPLGHLNLCTGAGKTRVQIALAHLCGAWLGKPIFIVVPTQELVEQTYQEFIKTQQDFAQCLDTPLLPSQIIKVSSMTNNLSQQLLQLKHQQQTNVFIFCAASFSAFQKSDRYFAPSIMILDEYHLIPKDIIVAAKKDDMPMIGLSATPVKESKHPLSKEIFKYSRLGALANEKVVPLVVEHLDMEYSPENYKQMLAMIPQLLLSHYQPNGTFLSSNKGIIYVNNIEDADDLAKAINNVHIPCVAIHSKNHDDTIQSFKQRDIGIAVAVRQLRVGYDDPRTYFIIDLQDPDKIDMVSQMVGRTMRIYESDPQKIGHVMTFKSKKMENSEIFTDEIAMQNAHPFFKFRYDVERLKNAIPDSQVINKFIKHMEETKNKKKFVEKVMKSRFNYAIDKICQLFIDIRATYKSMHKQTLNSVEYHQFKQADQFNSCLTTLHNQIMENEKCYEVAIAEPEKFILSFSSMWSGFMRFRSCEYTPPVERRDLHANQSVKEGMSM